MAKLPKLDEGMFWENGKIQFTYRNPLTKHSANKSTGCDDLEEARIFRADFLNSLKWRSQRGAGMTFGQMMLHYFEHLKSKGAAVENSEYLYGQIKHRIDTVRVADSQDILDTWVADALAGVPGTRNLESGARRKMPHEDTINTVIKRVRAGVRYCVKRKMFPKQLEPDWPMSKNVQRYPMRESTRRKVTYDQILIMLKLARATYLRSEVRTNPDGTPRLSVTARLFLIICWGGAQRAKRIGRLQHSNFFEQDGTLFLNCADVHGVRNFDNKSGSIVPITSMQMKVEIARMLREALPGNPWLFDKPLSPRDVRERLSKVSTQVIDVRERDVKNHHKGKIEKKVIGVMMGAHVLRRAAGSHFGKNTSSTNGSSVLGNTPKVFDAAYNLVDVENQKIAQQTLPEPTADPSLPVPDVAPNVVPLKRG